MPGLRQRDGHRRSHKLRRESRPGKPTHRAGTTPADNTFRHPRPRPVIRISTFPIYLGQQRAFSTSGSGLFNGAATLAEDNMTGIYLWQFFEADGFWHFSKGDTLLKIFQKSNFWKIFSKVFLLKKLPNFGCLWILPRMDPCKNLCIS